MGARAFTKLRNGRRRPVLLELPPDVAAEQVDETRLRYEPTRRYASAADARDVTRAIEMLRTARKPMLYVGQGVLWGEAAPELRAFAEQIGVPVMTTTLAKGVFPEDHPLALGIGGVEVTGMVDHYLRECDLVLALGASLTPSLAATPIPADKTIVHCTADPDDLHTEHRTSHAVIGDMKLVLAQLLDEARHQKMSDDGRAAAEVREVRERWLAQWAPKLASEETPISPYRIIGEMLATIDPAKAILTHDSGTPRAQLAPFWRAPLPRTYLGWGNAHQLGSSLGLIMGAKLAAPDKLCVAFQGDAALGMNGMDLETAVRERIPVLTVVPNNSWMSTYRNRIPEATERYKVGYMHGNYTQLAQALGCHAERVEHPAEILPALKRAIAATENGTPAVVEVMTKVEYSSSRLGATAP
jgi:thiamine pyrophosphate-dependent acetolactate synthase large subunit-like protein